MVSEQTEDAVQQGHGPGAVEQPVRRHDVSRLEPVPILGIIGVDRNGFDVAETYVRKRMRQLAIPENQIGEPNYGGYGTWRAFDPNGQLGGGCVTGVVVDSGVLNPELLNRKKGGRIYPELTVRERIDAAIAHEYAELRHGSHAEALKAAAGTELPIMPGARRLCRAMAG